MVKFQIKSEFHDLSLAIIILKSSEVDSTKRNNLIGSKLAFLLDYIANEFLVKCWLQESKIFLLFLKKVGYDHNTGGLDHYSGFCI